MRPLAVWIFAGLFFSFVLAGSSAEKETPEDLLDKAQQALSKGDLERSNAIAIQGLEILGESDKKPGITGAFHYLIGRILQQKGETDRAFESLSRALDLTDRAEQVDHEFRGDILYEKGVCWAQREKWEEAATCLGEALDLRERHLGADHTKVADTLEILARVEVSWGNVSAAMQSVTRAVEIYEKNLGLEHPTVVRAWFLLARVFRELQEFEKAEKELNRVLDAMNLLFGKEHPEVADVYRELGSVHLKLGNPDRAVGAFRATLYLEDLQFEKSDVRRVRTLLQLGEALVADEKSMDAELTFREAKTIAEEKLDENHVNVAFAWYGLGQIYTLWRNNPEAASAFGNALRIFESNPRHSGDMIRKSLIELHRVLVRLNRHEQLVPIKQKLVLFGVTEEELKELEIRKNLRLENDDGL